MWDRCRETRGPRADLRTDLVGLGRTSGCGYNPHTGFASCDPSGILQWENVRNHRLHISDYNYVCTGLISVLLQMA